ncbi:MAG: VOC family protein [Bacilli bacterium]|nr:VOC family protein [Bacilli bacterium]
MKLDGFGIFVQDMEKMVTFYRDVLGFDIQWKQGDHNVYLVKDGTLFLFYGRDDFEKMVNRKFEYVQGLNPHYEIALSVPSYRDVDLTYHEVIAKGAISVLPSETEPWGQRTCYIADPEHNLIEIGSFIK